MEDALKDSTEPIFVGLPFSPDKVEIVQIKCMPSHTEEIKQYLISKLGGDPRFGILPLDPKRAEPKPATQ